MLAKLILVFATQSVGQVTGKLDHLPTKPVGDTAVTRHYLFTKKKDGLMPFIASALKQTYM